MKREKEIRRTEESPADDPGELTTHLESLIRKETRKVWFWRTLFFLIVMLWIALEVKHYSHS